MSDVALPVFVLADDLLSFESLEALAQYIEPIDVAEVTAAFDASGCVIQLRALGVERSGISVGGGHIEVVVRHDLPRRPDLPRRVAPPTRRVDPLDAEFPRRVGVPR